MDDDILNDIARIRRLLNDARKEHDNGKGVLSQLDSLADELGHLLEKAEARKEDYERGHLDPRTRFVSELAAGFLRTMMERDSGGLTHSHMEQAVDMAAEVVRKVGARY